MTYGRCQKDGCTSRATHVVEFRNQPKDPFYACEPHARMYRRRGHQVKAFIR